MFSGIKLNLGDGSGSDMYLGEKMKIFKKLHLNGFHKVWLNIEKDLEMCAAIQWEQRLSKVGRAGIKLICWQETEFTGIPSSRTYISYWSQKRAIIYWCLKLSSCQWYIWLTSGMFLVVKHWCPLGMVSLFSILEDKI